MSYSGDGASKPKIKGQVRSKRTWAQRAGLLAIAGILFLSSVGSLTVFFGTESASAVTTSASKTSNDLDWQIKSFLYYRALAHCMKYSRLPHAGTTEMDDYIDKATSDTKWWGVANTTVFTGNTVPPAAPLIGMYMRDSTPDLDVGTDGQTNCDNANLVSAALSHWGLSATEVLCESGFRRVDGGNSQTREDCKSGSSNFQYRQGGSANAVTKFTTYIKKVVYGMPDIDDANTQKDENADVDLTMTDAQWYAYYKHTLANSCIPKIQSNGPSGGPYAADNKYGYNDVKWVNVKKLVETDGIEAKDGIETGSYIGSWYTTSPVSLRINPGPGFSNNSLPCADAVKKMNAFAEGYAEWALKNKSIALQADIDVGTGGGGGGGSGAPSSCAIEGIGWLVCAAAGAISGMVDGLYGLISGILTLNPLQQYDTKDPTKLSTQYQVWQNVRNIANVLLAIGFLIVIFSQITNIGISNYGVKKLLPRIVLIAIAINLSYILMSLAIDLTNILGTGIKTILDTTGNVDDAIASISYEKVTEAYLGGTAAGVAVAGIGVLAIGVGGLSASALALMALPFILGALLGVLAAFATMFIRNALVIVLAIIAPAAFAAALLPNTQGLFDKWRKLFISMLALFPLAALLFGGARLAAYITFSSEQAFAVIIGLFLLGAPLGALPFLIKSSNSVLAGIGNKLQGAARAARVATQKGLQPHVEKQKAQYQSGQKNFFGRRRANDNPARRTLAQRFDQSRQSRDSETQQAKEVGTERWREAGAAGTTRAGRRAGRTIDSRADLGVRKSANDAEIDERLQGRVAAGNTPAARYEARSFDAGKSSERNKEVTRARNLERVRTNAASTSLSGAGEGLGAMDRQRFAASEAGKSSELQIQRANLESGVADASIQGQKRAQEGINTHGVEQQAVFDAAIPHDADLTDLKNRQDSAKRISETENAELSERLATRGQTDAALADLTQRKLAAEDRTHLVDKQEGAEYAENRDANLAFDTAEAEDRTNLAGKQQGAAYAEGRDETLAYDTQLAENRQKAATGADTTRYNESLVNGDIDPTNPLAAQIQTARDLDEQTRIDSSRQAAATRVGDQQYAEELQNRPGMAQRAGGVDPDGASLVTAQAIETERKARDQKVTAYGIQLKDQGIPDRPDPANPGAPSLLGISQDMSRTSEEREAAGRAIVENGDIDSITDYQDYLANTYGQAQTVLASAQTGLQQAQASGAAPDEILRMQDGVAQAQQGVRSAQSLQQAYGERIASSPGKPMGLGAADIAAFKTGTYERPTPSAAIVRTGAGTDQFSVTELQTLNTVVDKGISMDNWAAMDKADIARVSMVAERGVVPVERREQLIESLNSTLNDPRWNGRIKDRERAQLTTLLGELRGVTGPSPAPSPTPTPSPTPGTGPTPGSSPAPGP